MNANVSKVQKCASESGLYPYSIYRLYYLFSIHTEYSYIHATLSVIDAAHDAGTQGMNNRREAQLGLWKSLL